MDYPYIPPCCVSSKLPLAMMDAPKRTLVFHTNCDVVFEDFYRAISSYISDPHVLVLNMSDPNIHVVRFLLQCFERKWITDLVLTTATDKRKLIESELKEYLSHVLYAVTPHCSYLTGKMVIYSDTQALTLCGPMFHSKPRELSMATYTLVYQSSFPPAIGTTVWGNHLRNVLMPDTLIHRSQNRTVIDHKSARLARFFDGKYIKPKTDE